MNRLILMIAILLFQSVVVWSAENPIYQELLDRGIEMTDGATCKLPPPILADGLDAAGQRAAIDKLAAPRASFDELVKKTYYAPVVVRVRTLKPSVDEGPAIRAVDLWFVVHGDWDTLCSKEFAESFAAKDEGQSRVVTQAGVLSDQEMAARGLSIATRKGYEERFVYTTFSLFERVELSATRRAAVCRGADSILAAGRVDPRFNRDADYPNQWRPLLRDAAANIRPGPPRPLPPAGGYAKITRLVEPADAALVECHLVFEEPFGWFDGVNLVKQKVPAMVQEKARTLRRKLAQAGKE